MRFTFKKLIIVFTILLSILTYVYYDKTRQIALENAQVKINEFLLNYKAFRSYVSSIQKQEIYRLQNEGKIDKGYFMPQVLSSTFSARAVNEFYNLYRENKGQRSINIRFASDNPRNLNNKATKEESWILKQFNEGNIDSYSKIIKTQNGKNLYYAVPTKRSTKECMKCHSDPKLAPSGMVEIYGDKNGFYEKEGIVRALLSTSYPLDEDLKYADELFFKLTFITFIIFVVSLLTVYLFMKKINLKNHELEKLNLTLDKKVIKRTKELEKERQFIKSIVDANPNIILVIDGKELVSANKIFFDTLGFKDMEEFRNKNACICDYFVSLDNKRFNINELIKGEAWYKYLVQNNEDIHNLTMEINGKEQYYVINAISLNGDELVLITLSDITELKLKDRQLYEQSKLASMGEMIGNIAHQWRQPLSVISTGASGMKIQKEFNTLSDEMFQETCDLIDRNAQFLSKTIDDFSNFIKGDRVKKEFTVKEILDDLLKLVKSSIDSNNIKLEVKGDESLSLEGYPNELIQCFINIFNNAKDVLKTLPQEQRYILIDIKKENDKVNITFSDTGGGIKEEYLNSIFEPYFTTKHKSQGTGLGLSMTYRLITEGMKGDIKVRNITLEYNGKSYKGAAFIITLPLS